MRCFTLLLLLALLPSCTAMKVMLGIGFEKPKVEVLGVDIGKSNMKSIELTVNLQIRNPNDFNIELRNVRYTVFNKSKKIVASGEHPGKVVLIAMGEQITKIPVKIKAERLGASLARFLLAPNQSQKFKIITVADFVSELGPIEIKSVKTEKICVGKCE